jgi:Bacterial HORMA domain 2
MSSSSTSTHTWTIVHTATHLADVILGSIVDILGHLGIDATRLFADWAQDEAAIMAWIAEKSLKAVVLECHQPNGTVSPILEFPVNYENSGVADGTFTKDRASLARYLAKLQTVPGGTVYKLFVTFNGPRSEQPGWGPGTRASTDGMRSRSFGTLAGAHHASASLRYLSKP